VHSLAPDVLANGTTIRVQGEGFPIAREGTLRLRGECISPGERPRSIEREVSIHAESSESAAFEVDDTLVRSFGGRSTCTLAGRVRFEGSRGAVIGRLRPVVVDIVPTGRDRVTALALGTDDGRAVARRIGLVFADEDPEGGGLRVASVVPSSLAARTAIAPGDVVVRLDGIRLHDLADFRPTPGIRRTELELHRAGRAETETVLVSALATDARSTASAYGYAAIAFLLLLVLAFLAPSARFVSFLARRSPNDSEETLAWLFGARTIGSTRERRLAMLVIGLAALGMVLAFAGIAVVGRYFVRDLGVSILLSASLALRLASRVFGESEESRNQSYLAFFVASAPLTIVVAAMGLLVGTGHFGELRACQGGSPNHWLVFANPIAFALFPVFAATALTRVEPDGTRSRLAMVAARAHLLVVSALGAALFLGGWSVPVSGWSDTAGTVCFVVKSFALLGLGLWARDVSIGDASSIWKWTVPTSVLGLALAFLYSAAELPAELERISGFVLSGATAIVLVYVLGRRMLGSDDANLVVHPFI